MTETGSNVHSGQPRPLYKHKSWSPDILREEAWLKRRKNHRCRIRGSVCEDDLEELRACLELGFSFDSPDLDLKLASTLPALEFYHTVTRNSLIRSPSATFSDSDNSVSGESPKSIFSPGDDPETVKMKLKQWAQVVACSVRHSSPRLMVVATDEGKWR